MKANELHIEDLVMVDGYPARVCELTRGTFSYSTPKGVMRTYVKNAGDIFLTDEILEHNDFVLTKKGRWVLNACRRSIFVDQDDDGFYIVAADRIRRLNTVVDLQAYITFMRIDRIISVKID